MRAASHLAHSRQDADWDVPPPLPEDDRVCDTAELFQQFARQEKGLTSAAFCGQSAEDELFAGSLPGTHLNAVILSPC